MDADKLEELERLLKAGTPGPWVTDGHGAIGVQGKRYGPAYPPRDGSIMHGMDGEYIENPNSTEDAALICAAINALPELVARVRELEGALAHIETHLSRGRDMLALDCARASLAKDAT